MRNVYWRVTYLAANGRPRRVWARSYSERNNGYVTFVVVNRDGDEYDPMEVVLAAKTDVVCAEAARFNNMYATLEVVHG